MKSISLTYILIALCVVVALFTSMGTSYRFMQPLLIVDPRGDAWTEIWNTQPWRLFTPMFIHFGFLHLLFNMSWLKDLGSLIEWKKGSVFLGVLVMIMAGFSNLLQFYFGHSPMFGGMSGVVYGLFGYVWMQGRYNRRFGYVMPQNTIIIMLVWFVVCLTGLLGNIANWAHAGGLIAGVALGRSEEWLHPKR